MKYDLKTTLILLALFSASQILGLIVIRQGFSVMSDEYFESEEVISDAIYSLPISIIMLTLLFLIIHKLGFKKLLVGWYALAFITCVTVTLSVFINDLYALFIGLGLFLLKISSKDNYYHNMTELFIYGGIALLIVPLLNIVSAIILLLIISVYDFIAVKLSKHMISLAKSQFELNIFTGLKIETKDGSAILGGGDMAFPLVLAGVVLKEISLLPAILVAYGALVGLITLVLIGRENKFYPAMPFITSGCLVGLMVYSLTLF